MNHRNHVHITVLSLAKVMEGISEGIVARIILNFHRSSSCDLDLLSRAGMFQMFLNHLGQGVLRVHTIQNLVNFAFNWIVGIDSLEYLLDLLLQGVLRTIIIQYLVDLLLQFVFCWVELRCCLGLNNSMMICM